MLLKICFILLSICSIQNFTFRVIPMGKESRNVHLFSSRTIFGRKFLYSRWALQQSSCCLHSSKLFSTSQTWSQKRWHSSDNTSTIQAMSISDIHDPEINHKMANIRGIVKKGFWNTSNGNGNNSKFLRLIRRAED